MKIPDNYYGIQLISPSLIGKQDIYYKIFDGVTIKDFFLKNDSAGVITSIIDDLIYNSFLKDSIFGDDTTKFELSTVAYNISRNDFNLKMSAQVGVYAYRFLSKYGKMYIGETFKNIYSNLRYFRNVGHNLIYINNVSSIFLSIFKDKWERIADIFSNKYDTFKPYDIKLHESKSNDFETLEDNSTTGVKNQRYGFNTSTPQPTDIRDTTTNNTYKRKTVDTRDYTRSGNSGNISYSQLAIQELEKDRFIVIDEIFKDIASVMGRGTYKIN